MATHHGGSSNSNSNGNNTLPSIRSLKSKFLSLSSSPSNSSLKKRFSTQPNGPKLVVGHPISSTDSTGTINVLGAASPGGSYCQPRGLHASASLTSISIPPIPPDKSPPNSPRYRNNGSPRAGGNSGSGRAGVRASTSAIPRSISAGNGEFTRAAGGPSLAQLRGGKNGGRRASIQPGAFGSASFNGAKVVPISISGTTAGSTSSGSSTSRARTTSTYSANRHSAIFSPPSSSSPFAPSHYSRSSTPTSPPSRARRTSSNTSTIRMERTLPSLPPDSPTSTHHRLSPISSPIIPYSSSDTEMGANHNDAGEDSDAALAYQSESVAGGVWDVDGSPNPNSVSSHSLGGGRDTNEEGLSSDWEEENGDELEVEAEDLEVEDQDQLDPLVSLRRETMSSSSSGENEQYNIFPSPPSRPPSTGVAIPLSPLPFHIDTSPNPNPSTPVSATHSSPHLLQEETSRTSSPSTPTLPSSPQTLSSPHLQSPPRRSSISQPPSASHSRQGSSSSISTITAGLDNFPSRKSVQFTQIDEESEIETEEEETETEEEVETDAEIVDVKDLSEIQERKMSDIVVKPLRISPPPSSFSHLPHSTSTSSIARLATSASSATLREEMLPLATASIKARPLSTSISPLSFAPILPTTKTTLPSRDVLSGDLVIHVAGPTTPLSTSAGSSTAPTLRERRRLSRGRKTQSEIFPAAFTFGSSLRGSDLESKLEERKRLGMSLSSPLEDFIIGLRERRFSENEDEIVWIERKRSKSISSNVDNEEVLEMERKKEVVPEVPDVRPLILELQRRRSDVWTQRPGSVSFVDDEVETDEEEEEEEEEDVEDETEGEATAMVRSLSVEQMEKEIARMEAELRLSGLPSPTPPVQPTEATTTEVTPRTARRWSIVEVEEAYDRMKTLLGSSKSSRMTESSAEGDVSASGILAGGNVDGSEYGEAFEVEMWDDRKEVLEENYKAFSPTEQPRTPDPYSPVDTRHPHPPSIAIPTSPISSTTRGYDSDDHPQTVSSPATSPVYPHHHSGTPSLEVVAARLSRDVEALISQPSRRHTMAFNSPPPQDSDDVFADRRSTAPESLSSQPLIVGRPSVPGFPFTSSSPNTSASATPDLPTPFSEGGATVSTPATSPDENVPLSRRSRSPWQPRASSRLSATPGSLKSEAGKELMREKRLAEGREEEGSSGSTSTASGKSARKDRNSTTESWWSHTPGKAALRVKAVEGAGSRSEREIESASEVRNMDKLQLFFKYAAMKAELDKTEFERDALMDALEESRAALLDVRDQRDLLREDVANERAASRRLQEMLGADRETNSERLEEAVRSEKLWEKRARETLEDLDGAKLEIEDLKRMVLEGRERENRLEQQNARLARLATVGDFSPSQPSFPPNTAPLTPPTTLFLSPMPSTVSSVGIDLNGLGDLGSPIMGQQLHFANGAKSSFGSNASPLKGRSHATQRISYLGQNYGATMAIVERERHASNDSSIESSDYGDHLPLPKERDWNPSGSTGSSIPELSEEHDMFLSDLSETIVVSSGTKG